MLDNGIAALALKPTQKARERGAPRSEDFAGRRIGPAVVDLRPVNRVPQPTQSYKNWQASVGMIFVDW
jgi:hypothetical protein